jgi:hypothetical protein
MAQNDEMPTALSGIRVLNAGQILAAPFCGSVLAEFGAEVIKVENPDGGDPNRGNLSFFQDNRGQKSVTINLNHPAASSCSGSSPTRPTSSSKTSGPARSNAWSSHRIPFVKPTPA